MKPSTGPATSPGWAGVVAEARVDGPVETLADEGLVFLESAVAAQHGLQAKAGPRGDLAGGGVVGLGADLQANPAEHLEGETGHQQNTAGGGPPAAMARQNAVSDVAAPGAAGL